jgi:hypothetical protein
MIFSTSSSGTMKDFVTRFLLLGVSYNQPKLCPLATWNPNAATVPTSTVSSPNNPVVHVDINNTVYATERNNNRVRIWFNGNLNSSKIIGSGSYLPKALFSTITGDIYIATWSPYNHINKWTANATSSDFTLFLPTFCYGLFIDTIDRIYCSTDSPNQVIRTFVTNAGNKSTIMAGTASVGSAPDQLNSPRGIFVDDQFNLYVADYYNNRIQLFRPDQRNGTTVAGSGIFTLSWPTGVVLDADKYLFIVEHFGNRLVRSGPHGFYCIAGCSSRAGSSPSRLDNPYSLSFDSYGNLFVGDQGNRRIQKFSFTTKSCGKCPFLLSDITLLVTDALLLLRMVF